MLITHHQKSILDSFFSVLMDIHWKNHIPSTFHPHGRGDTHYTHICELAGKDHGSGLLQECGHHEIEEAHWRRWVEMKSLILVSPAQCSHQPNWSISLTDTPGHLFLGEKTGMCSFASGSLHLLPTIWRCSFNLLVLLANSSSSIL